MPTYALKSNATMTAAKAVFIGDHPALVNLVDGSAITNNGGVTTSTIGGKTAYGYGDNTDGKYLSLSLASTIPASTKFAILYVGRYAVDIANFDTYPIVTPGGSIQAIGTTTTGPKIKYVSTYLGAAGGGVYPSYAFPNTTTYTTIVGRETGGKINTYQNGTATTVWGGDSGSNGEGCSAGTWKFAGRPSTGQPGGFGALAFAIFVGIGPDELAAYIAAAGGDAIAAMADVSASGPTINTQPTNQTVTAPAAATFTVSATASGGSLTYQWQRSTNSGSTWANVTTGTGGTTASYTTAATSVSGGNANNGDQFHCVVTDSNGSINSNAATLTVNAAAGPTLTSPTIAGVGSTTATPGIATDTASGTLCLVLPTTNTAPSAAQVKAGQNAAGAAAPSNSQAITATGAKTAAMTGLSAGATYYPFWVHTNGSGVDSAVTAGTSFTTSAAAATAVTMSGPTAGLVGAASTNFTVGANGAITGTVTVTPSDGGGGSFSPASVTISSVSPTATFTYTPATAGAKTISASNNGGLSNPSTITYTATALPTVSWTLKNNTGTLLVSTTVPKVKIIRLSDMASILDLTNQTSAPTTALMTVANAAMTSGVDYLALCSDATGANVGVQKVTAA